VEASANTTRTRVESLLEWRTEVMEKVEKPASQVWLSGSLAS